MWEKGFQYLKKMGGVILFASIIIWALGYFPREVNFSKNYDDLITQSKGNEKVVASLEIQKESERFEGSYIGKIGHFIEPVIQPLGFDWKMGISLVTGMAAKELVVSTMGVLYQVGEDTAEDSQDLINKLQSHTYQYGEKRGQKVFTPLIAYSFMLFILIYFPCVAVIAAIKKESGGWKWAIFTMVYTTGLAYFVSFAVYQIGSMFI
jgi:ferrous iron transport protein B